MSDPAANDRRTGQTLVPREIPRDVPCHECGGVDPVINGLYYKFRRQDVGLTMVEEAKVLGISVSRLCRMENGDVPFPKHLAQLLDRLLERRRKAGSY